CEEFDRRLAADMASDELVERVRRAGDRGALESAARAVRGLRRLEELEEDPPADERVRARLALEGLLGLEELARLGRAPALIVRARLRRVAIPGPLGAALARLDLARASRYWRWFAQGSRGEQNAGDISCLALHGASVAAALPDAKDIE